MGDLKERIAVLETKVDGLGPRLEHLDTEIAGLGVKADLATEGIMALRLSAEKNNRWTKRELAMILGLASVGGGSGGAILKVLSVIFGGH